MYLKDDSCNREEDLWRWECLSKLQDTIANMDMNEEDLYLPGSIELILLFILGLPGDLMELNFASTATLASGDGNHTEETTLVTDNTKGSLTHSRAFASD